MREPHPETEHTREVVQPDKIGMMTEARHGTVHNA